MTPTFEAFDRCINRWSVYGAAPPPNRVGAALPHQRLRGLVTNELKTTSMRPRRILRGRLRLRFVVAREAATSSLRMLDTLYVRTLHLREINPSGRTDFGPGLLPFKSQLSGPHESSRLSASASLVALTAVIIFRRFGEISATTGLQTSRCSRYQQIRPAELAYEDDLRR